jgi:hypothetical protein
MFCDNLQCLLLLLQMEYIVTTELLFVSLALQPSAGYDLVPRGFLITHNDAPQSVGLLLDE